ncbi:MAG: electron transfer flavoprotein subunit beta/FixA family protein [Gaiellales bacterium]
MKTVVCVKQVRVLGDEVELTTDGLDVDPDYVDTALNEWDAYATEEAIRLREAHAGEVVAVTYGSSDSEAALRRCLAMGADRAIRVEAPVAGDPLAVAQALAAVVREENADLVLCGVQSSDAVQAATGTALAELLGLPRVAVVAKLELAAGVGHAVVHRELEGGLVDVVEVDLPAVLTIQTGINEPRYANLRAIKQAEQVEITVTAPPEVAPGSRVRRMFVPPRGEGAELLGTEPAEVACRIAEIVKERLQ